MKANGAILWRGASLLDGAPIVVIATGLAHSSNNAKTGAMIQTYILREDISPIDAVKSGADASICGDCPHRGRLVASSVDGAALTSDANPSADASQVFEKLAQRGHMVGRTCYVNVGQGPLAVWRAYKRVVYPRHDLTRSLVPFRGRAVRFGTYGDPAAAPAWIWSALASVASGHTGYTHQWRNASQLRGLCMASADSVADATEAQGQGWRTFRVAMPCDTGSTAREITCPASAEAGKKLTCAQCLACSGADGRRSNITINAHGGWAVMAHVNRRGIRAYFARS